MGFCANASASRIVMVKEHLQARGIHDARVLDAFREVPREDFVLPEDVSRAYDDSPLKIGYDQTISQPYIVALTCQLLEIKPADRVLEIGAGSGYETAILSRLCGAVVSVERVPELMEAARRRIERMRITNVRIILADGTCGAAEHAPFDAVAVTAAAPAVPAPLAAQLSAGGRMVIPIGNRIQQELFLFRKSESGALSKTKLCDCRFVPLIGQFGFDAPARPADGPPAS